LGRHFLSFIEAEAIKDLKIFFAVSERISLNISDNRAIRVGAGSIFVTLDEIWSLVVIGLVVLPLIVALLGLMIAKKRNLL
jgi:hypothetical protein